jgi:hypothetical protein
MTILRFKYPVLNKKGKRYRPKSRKLLLKKIVKIKKVDTVFKRFKKRYQVSLIIRDFYEQIKTRITKINFPGQ